MAGSDFIKGACRQCAGHLEFPADAAGQTITCPHCGQPTELLPPAAPPKAGSSLRLRLAVGIAAALAAAIPVFFLMTDKTDQSSGTGALPLPPPATNATEIAAHPKKSANLLTNDFSILPYKLEKSPGSALVYVTGTLRNKTDHQRFGVKVQFKLLDTNDTAIGTASDYQSVLEPNAEWNFKALVIESKAVKATFSSIAEDK